MTGKKIFLTSAIISILIILAAGGLWFLLGSNPNLSSLINKEPNPKKDYVLSESVVELPYPLNDNRVTETAISYTFSGVISQLRNESAGTEIIIDEI